MQQYTYVGRIGNRLLTKGFTITPDYTIKPYLGGNKYIPSYYIESPHKNASSFANVRGTPLKKIECTTVGEFSEGLKRCETQMVQTYGNANWEYDYIREFHYDRNDYKTNLVRVAYFDIETERSIERGYAKPTDPFNKVTLITAYFPFLEKYKDEVLVWMLECPDSHHFEYDETVRIFGNDIDLIEDFFKFMTDAKVDVITGWNIEGYDVPYLCNRLLMYSNGRYEVDDTWNRFDTEQGKYGFASMKSITPFGKIKKIKWEDDFGNPMDKFNLYGWEVLDYISLYKKFTYVTQESYTLNHICSVELGEKKVDYSEHQYLQSLYEEDFEKFVAYGRKDTLLVYKLEQKLQYINLALTMAYMAGCNFSDIFSPVRLWGVFLYHIMFDKGIIHPIRQRNSLKDKQPEKKEKFIGAFVKDPLRGKHDWVVSFDLNSLYPHIMMFSNMSPDTYIPEDSYTEQQATLHTLLHDNIENQYHESIEGLIARKFSLNVLKEIKNTITPNGTLFDTSRHGIIPVILKDLYNRRKEIKKNMLALEQELENTTEENTQLTNAIAVANAQQMALKIMLNSLYGAYGNEGFIFYNINTALGITTMGQLAIRYISKKIEDFLNGMLKSTDKQRIAYCDTDSSYVILDDVVGIIRSKNANLDDQQVTTLLDKFVNDKIQPLIDSSYADLKEYLNGYEQSFKMKREKICKSILFVQKKRYTCAVMDSEGVRFHQPKISTTGLESVRSTTPEIVRKQLRHLEELVLLHGEEDIRNFVKQFEKAFKQLSIEEIALVKSVRDIGKWVGTTTEAVKKKASVKTKALIKSNDQYSYALSTPIQVKASLLYNKIMTQHDKNAEVIKDGDKIHLVYIKNSPRFFHERCIAYPQLIPKELGLAREDVDWCKMYDKVFLAPCKIILDAMGIQIESTTNAKNAVSLSNFF